MMVQTDQCVQAFTALANEAAAAAGVAGIRDPEALATFAAEVEAAARASGTRDVGAVVAFARAAHARDGNGLGRLAHDAEALATLARALDSAIRATQPRDVQALATLARASVLVASLSAAHDTEALAEAAMAGEAVADDVTPAIEARAGELRRRLARARSRYEHARIRARKVLCLGPLRAVSHARTDVRRLRPACRRRAPRRAVRLTAAASSGDRDGPPSSDPEASRHAPRPCAGGAS